MRHAVAEDRTVVLAQEVYAAWARENAAGQANSLYRLAPHARLVWAGNDLMAFGAMAAWDGAAASPAWTRGSAASIRRPRRWRRSSRAG